MHLGSFDESRIKQKHGSTYFTTLIIKKPTIAVAVDSLPQQGKPDFKKIKQVPRAIQAKAKERAPGTKRRNEYLKEAKFGT